MKKENFITLVLGVLGGLLFSIGLCCCLIPEWNAFDAGVGVAVLGAVLLIVLYVYRRKVSGKAPVKLDRKTLGAVCLGIIGALTLGTGMCMVMVWDMLLWGILAGVVGIGLLLCLIPLCLGLK